MILGEHARGWGWRRRSSSVALAVLVAAVALAGCGSSDAGSGSATTTTKPTKAKTTTTTTEATGEPNPAAPSRSDLTGSFVVDDLIGYELVPGSQVTMTFDGDQLTVNAGCNTMGSGYDLDGNVLRWEGVPRTTLVACTAEAMAQDTWITGLLVEGVDVELEGNALTLSSGDVEISLQRVAGAPLFATKWTLDGTITDGAGAQPLPAGVEPPTLVIDQIGTVTAFTGCNRGTTTVQVESNQLTFAPLALTRMACSDPATAVEARVTSILDGAVGYKIEGDTLIITIDDDGLVFKAP